MSDLKKQLRLEDIININDTAEEDVPMPEWGKGVYIRIRSMTGEGRDAYEQSLFKADSSGNYERDLSNARAKLIAACAIGPDGQRMFKDESHVKMLGNKSSVALDRLFSACQKLNAIGDTDMDELVGKSETDQP